MAYNLTASFWSFSKRRNSTKRPAAASATDYHYAEKEDTSVLSPTLEFHDAGVLPFNYCYLPKYGRYYYVRDKRSTAYGTYEIDLDVDVAASWGPSTYGQSVMAQMSSNFYDTELDDDRVQALDPISPAATTHVVLPMFPVNYQIETLASFVTGPDGKFGGSDVFFNLDSVGNVLTLLDALFDPDEWRSAVDSILSNDSLSVLNGIWAVPFKVDECHNTATATRNIDLGFINTKTISGAIINGPYVERHQGNLAIPTPSVSDFRFSDRFVKYYVNIPFIGVTTIPATLAKYQRSLYYECSADAVSGAYCISLYCGGVCLGMWQTNLKTELALSKQTSQTAAAIASGVKGAGAVGLAGAATKAGLKGGLIGAIAGAAVGAFRGAAVTPDIEHACSSSGSLAPAARYSRDLEIYMFESESSVDPATFTQTVGRPTQKVIQLASGIGYVQTAAASVSFAGYQPEIDSFNALLDGGLYYE